MRQLVRNVSVALAVSLSTSVALPALAQDQGLAGAYLAARHASFFSDHRAAAEYYIKALARDRTNPMLLENAVLAYTGLGQVERAVPIARQMQISGIDSQVGHMIVLAGQLNDENYRQALDDLEAGRSIGPLVDGLVKAWGHVALGDAAAAAAAFDEAASATGLKAFGLYHKALAMAAMGKFEEADAIFAGDEGGPLRLTRRGTMAYAQVLSQLDRNQDALDIITRAYGTDLDPGLSQLVESLGAGEKLPFTQISSGNDGLAEVFYTVAGALRGEAADSYTLLYSRIAEYLRPNHTDAILLTAGLLESQKQYDLATETYDRVQRDHPAYHAAELGRAEALRRSGKPDAATEVLKQLTETHASLPAVHITLGDVLRQQERYGEASVAYDAAIELIDDPRENHWIVFYARGIAHERTDQWNEAEPDFRKALELRPDQPQVLNYLGYSMVEMQTDLEEALEMIQRAVAARPDSGYITDSLGWVLYRMGRYEEAVTHLERATELMPVDPIVNDHLGDAYWAVGRKIEAAFQWNRAMSFDPEPEEAERIRRKLEVGLDEVLAEEGEPPLRVAADEG
ncbi:tetratricopeptide repeat protein [Actibacterium sp. 188UL27-1]|uniref:tetratricopeptide repeat protein n=1 Tax=Actibacterium sp. 188UL27-1 TaxID=2786961 RepID=UPI00351C3C1E